jgi:CRP-like cAMP-binding protein
MAWYNPFKRSFSQEELVQFRFLSNVKLFAGMSNQELSGLLPYLFVREYKENEVVFFREDPSAALYLIRSGSVTLNLDIDGRLETLTNIKAYGFFGEEALIDGQKRIYNAVIDSEEAELVVIPQANINDHCERNKGFNAKLYSNLSKIQSDFQARLFKAYRQEFGLFELKLAFRKKS